MKPLFWLAVGISAYHWYTNLTPPQPTAQELQQLQQQRFEHERALQRERDMGETIREGIRSRASLFSNTLGNNTLRS